MMGADIHIYIERKMPSDLLASIADNRLFNQVAEMRKQTPWVYVVITGELVQTGGFVRADGRTTNWRWASLQGALLSAQELGAAIMYCANDHEYAGALEALATHSRTPVRVDPKRDTTMLTPGEAILTALPGISEVRARALLQYCGSAANALSHLSLHTLAITSTEKIPGIGPATKQAARAALGLRDDQVLEILSE
jgi:ERCC4-type nuclease